MARIDEATPARLRALVERYLKRAGMMRAAAAGGLAGIERAAYGVGRRGDGRRAPFVLRRGAIIADTLTPSERGKRMSRVRSRDTKPEMLVRRVLHAMGYRYRLQANDLPGRPDIILRGRRKAIFVHGCFWHRHPDPACRLARLPKSHLDFWMPKLEGNRQRDEANLERLRDLGWDVLVLWECELRDREALGNKLAEFIEGAS